MIKRLKCKRTGTQYEPVIYAEWIETEADDWVDDDYALSGGHPVKIRTYTCPICGAVESKKYPYCHCGAKMIKEE